LHAPLMSGFPCQFSHVDGFHHPYMVALSNISS
jgi:hypothetical protein